MSGPPPVPGGRSADERERARRERAARRSGVRPSTPAALAADADGGEARGPRAGRSRVPRTPRPPRSAVKARRRVALALLALVLVAVVWFLWSLFQPLHGDGHGRVAVTVPRNAGVGEIGEVLEQKGVVASQWFFQARARLGGRSGDLKPGAYTLKRDMSYGAALDALAKGPPPNVVSLVVPEGKSRREIAPSIKSLEGDYLAATKRSRLLDPARYGAKGARDLEGFLFPATYQLKRGQNVKALVDKQLQTFKQRFATVDLRASKKVNLTPY